MCIPTRTHLTYNSDNPWYLNDVIQIPGHHHLPGPEVGHLHRLTSSTLPLWTLTVWSTLQSSEHQNDQTQKQFLSPSNPSHEHLTLNMEHTTLLYNYLFTTDTYFEFQICTYYTCTHIIVFIIYIYCFCTLPICILFFYYLRLVLLLSFCSTVELLSL